MTSDAIEPDIGDEGAAEATGRDLGAGRPAAVQREIGHDEYDPVGTLALIGLYFLVLVVLWLFMYFVEFVGNDPTVVGSITAVVGALATLGGVT